METDNIATRHKNKQTNKQLTCRLSLARFENIARRQTSKPSATLAMGLAGGLRAEICHLYVGSYSDKFIGLPTLWFKLNYFHGGMLANQLCNLNSQSKKTIVFRD